MATLLQGVVMIAGRAAQVRGRGRTSREGARVYRYADGRPGVCQGGRWVHVTLMKAVQLAPLAWGCGWPSDMVPGDFLGLQAR